MAVAALAAACNKGGLQAVQPSLQVSTSALQFPLQAFAQTSPPQTITLTSTSAADVAVQLSLSGPQAGDFAIAPSDSATIAGNQSLAIQVTYLPPLPTPIPTGKQSASAVLTIGSNDPTKPTTLVTLTGSAEAPRLDLCWNNGTTLQCLSQGPLTVELGTVSSRQPPAQVELDLIDLTPEVALTVTSLKLDAAAQTAGYAFVETIPAMIVLSPQVHSVAFHVGLSPRSPGLATGLLSVTSDDPRAGGMPVTATLDATVSPLLPPVACLGINELDYVDGTMAIVDPTRSLLDQPSIIPPGPLDSAKVTALVSQGCSFDPQDGQNLSYAFSLTTPQGSNAQLATPIGHPEERTVQFDLSGNYEAAVVVTDDAGLSATLDAGPLVISVQPQDDLSATVSWTGEHEVNLDLHLVRDKLDAGTAQLVDDPQNDCFYCNCLLASNYSGGSPCSTTSKPFPTSLAWGTVPPPVGSGNPLLVASEGFNPFKSLNADRVRLVGPEPGASYGLYVHYYRAYQSQTPTDAGGACLGDGDCVDPVYASCVQGRCLPITTASLQGFVVNQSLTDGGAPLQIQLRRPCDLWWAGTVHWVSGGHLVDGGFAAPTFGFEPAPDGGVAVSNGAIQGDGLTCGTL